VRARLPVEVSDAAKAEFLRCLADGVVRVLDSPRRDLSMQNALLPQRRRLAEVVQELWAIADFGRAVRMARALRQLLSLARLTIEFDAWALSFLEHNLSPSEVTEHEVVARLALATFAAHAPSAGASAAIAAEVDRWMARLWNEEWRRSPDTARWMAPALAVCCKVLDARGEHDAYRDLCKLVCQHYTDIGDVERAQQQKLAWAAAEYELGNAQLALELEVELLSHPRLGAETRAREAALVQIASMRMRRRDVDGCRSLLDQLPNDVAAQPLAGRVLALRAELNLLTGDLEGAAQKYCVLWRTATSGAASEAINETANKLDQLAQALGAETFQKIYREHAGTGPTPAELGLGGGS
jgi:hypothetical protein